METYIAATLFLFITILVYARVGFANIANSYRMWFEDGYWVNYNVVGGPSLAGESCSDFARAHMAKGNLGAAHCYLADIGSSHLGL